MIKLAMCLAFCLAGLTACGAGDDAKDKGGDTNGGSSVERAKKMKEELSDAIDRYKTHVDEALALLAGVTDVDSAADAKPKLEAIMAKAQAEADIWAKGKGSVKALLRAEKFKVLKNYELMQQIIRIEKNRAMREALGGEIKFPDVD